MKPFIALNLAAAALALMITDVEGFRIFYVIGALATIVDIAIDKLMNADR